jgi:hypothetical protein
MSLTGDLHAVLDRLVDRDVAGLPDAVVRDDLLAVLSAVNRLNAVAASMTASFDARSSAEADACRSTRAWLIAFGRLTPAAATRLLDQGRLLRELPALAAAAQAGDASSEHVARVVELAEHVGVPAVRQVEPTLAEAAVSVRPAEFRVLCNRVRAHLDPDGAEPDPGAFDRRSLTVSRVGSFVYLRGQLDLEAGATMMSALDALMAAPSAGDERTAAQRRADALVDLCRLAHSREWLPTVAGQRPQLGLLVTPETLKRAPGAEPADLDWVGSVPTSVAQRLACDAQLWRVALDPATGLPLDLGRTRRLVPGWLRKALHARDRGCRWPGCTAPSGWTDAHHVTAWYEGGTTDVANLLLLCRYHHMKVHEGQWRMEFDHDTGVVTVFRPDGTPYEIGASQPWTSPATRRGDPELPRAA